MRRNKILSNIERVQARDRSPETLLGLVAPRAAIAAREETRKRMAETPEPGEIEETGGMRGLAEELAEQAKAAGFRPKKELTIAFIKNAEGEIIGARIT